MTSGAALATLTGRWQSVAGAWLAEVQQRTGSEARQRFELPASAQVLIVSIYDVEYSENCPDPPQSGN